MALFSNTKLIHSAYPLHVRDFGRLYEFHSLRTGSPQDFLQLAPKLASSEGFRLDFSDLVRTIRDRERGGLSAADMLTMAALAIGGTEVAASEMDLCESAGTLQVLLAGVGGWKEPGTQGVHRTDPRTNGAEPASYAPALLATEEAGFAGGGSTSVEVPGGRRAVGSPEEGASPEMQETLARLELANMQLKIYLDDIDRRMGRIEPNLEDLTAMVHSSAEYFQRKERDGGQPGGPLVAESPVKGNTLPARRRRSEEAIAAAMEMSWAERGEKGERDWTSTVDSASDAEDLGTGADQQTTATIAEQATMQVEPERPRRRSIIWEVREPESAPKPSVQTAPSEIVLGEILPGEVLPAEVLPEEVLPVEVLPDEVLPAEVLPVEILPVETPVEASSAAIEGISAPTDAVETAAATSPRPDAWAQRDAESGTTLSRPSKVVPVAERRPKLRADVLAERAVSKPESGVPAHVSPVLLWGRKRGAWAWGAIAASLLIGGALLAYVYHPWDGAGSNPVSAPTGAAAGSTNPSAQQGSAIPGSSPAVRHGESAALTPGNTNATSAAGAGVSAERARQARRLQASTGRKLTGTQGAEAQPGADRGSGRVAASAVPASGTSRTIPADAAKRDEVRQPTEPPRDRVEGARAAEVLPAPRIENLRPDEPVGKTATGDVPSASAHVESAAIVTEAPSPTPIEPVKADPGADVPRAGAGKPALVAPTTGGTVLVSPAPSYPQQARQMGLEGRVVVQATVDKEGKVKSAKVVKGPVLLHQSAQDAVMRRRYRPFLLHGEPSEFQTMVTLNYKLQK